MSGTAERRGAAEGRTEVVVPAASAPPGTSGRSPAGPDPSASAPAPAPAVRGPIGIRLPAQLPARCLGVALALASCNVSAAVHHSLSAWLMFVVVAGVAWWAAPMIDQRPVQNSLRWTRIAARRRPTVFAVASVVAAAITDPPTWVAACVAGLFLAYLLITDDWTMGSAAPRSARRPAPALTAAAAVTLTFVCATVPVASTDWARLPAALALAATVTCVALAVRGRRFPR